MTARGRVLGGLGEMGERLKSTNLYGHEDGEDSIGNAVRSNIRAICRVRGMVEQSERSFHKLHK